MHVGTRAFLAHYAKAAAVPLWRAAVFTADASAAGQYSGIWVHFVNVSVDVVNTISDDRVCRSVR